MLNDVVRRTDHLDYLFHPDPLYFETGIFAQDLRRAGPTHETHARSFRSPGNTIDKDMCRTDSTQETHAIHRSFKSSYNTFDKDMHA